MAEAATAQNTLRGEILHAALYDWVPMIEINQIVTQHELAATDAERFGLVMTALRTLLDDGLVSVGDLPGDGNQAPDWGLSVTDAIERINDEYVVHYGEPIEWEFRIWIGLTPKGRLRAEVLAGGLYESVSMADMQGYIDRLRLATADTERQQLMLDAIRSLLADGLIVVGDIPGPNDPEFPAWPGETDAVMTKLTGRIVGQWTKPELWDYSTWLDLTPAGRAAAKQKQDQERTTMTEPTTVTQQTQTLRSDILAMGADDYVSLADVQALVTDGRLADTKEQRQALVVATVRSLLADGLAVVGDIPGRNDPGFKPWPGSVGAVMARFISLFVDRYEDRIEWEYRIWINLTDAGERVAAEAGQKRQ